MVTKLRGVPLKLPIAEPSEADFTAMGKAGRLRLDDSHRRQVAEALDRYVTKLVTYQLGPRPRFIREQLNMIKDAALRLVKALSPDSGRSPATLIALAKIRDRTPPDLLDLKALVRSLSAIVASARRAAQLLPADLGGRRADPFIADLVRELHTVFTSAGGRGKLTRKSDATGYSGPFYDFVRAALAALPQEFRPTDIAIGRRIERALR